MRRCEHFLSRYVGVANNPVLRCLGPAIPLVIVGEANRQISAGAFEAESMKCMVVEPCRTSIEGSIVRTPRRNWIAGADPRCSKNCIREFCNRSVFIIV